MYVRGYLQGSENGRVITIDGEHFKKSALHTLRYGLKRFLNDSINVDISYSRTFPDSNKMFHAVLVDLKKRDSGKLTTSHPLLRKISQNCSLAPPQLFYVQSPTGLLNKIWFELMLHLCQQCIVN